MKANQNKCHFLLSLDTSTKILLPPCILESWDSQKLWQKVEFSRTCYQSIWQDKQNYWGTYKNFPIYPSKTTFNECLFCLNFFITNSITISVNCTKEQLVYNHENKFVTMHHRNLQTLAYEEFKVKNNMTLEILTEIFPQKESNYRLRNSTALHR